MIGLLKIARGLSVGDTYRKNAKYNKIVEILSFAFSLFLHHVKRIITFLLKCVCLLYENK